MGRKVNLEEYGGRGQNNKNILLETLKELIKVKKIMLLNVMKIKLLYWPGRGDCFIG